MKKIARISAVILVIIVLQSTAMGAGNPSQAGNSTNDTASYTNQGETGNSYEQSLENLISNTLSQLEQQQDTSGQREINRPQ